MAILVWGTPIYITNEQPKNIHVSSGGSGGSVAAIDDGPAVERILGIGLVAARKNYTEKIFSSVVFSGRCETNSENWMGSRGGPENLH